MMQVSFFENAYFLQAIGWAIANNLWQAAGLWVIYKALVGANKNLSALAKYYSSLVFLGLSFVCFVFTAAQKYQLLVNATSPASHFYLSNLHKPVTILLPIFAGAYFLMLGFYLATFIQNFIKLRFISTKGLIKAPLDVRLFTTEKAFHLGIKRKISVWVSTNIDVPSVTGYFKPMILLPLAMINNLTTNQVNAILLHELAHIKRNDFIINLLQSIIALILFFNPFVALLSKTVKKERENCCDDWVLNFEFNQLDYAKALLFLEEQRHQKIHLALAATDSTKLLSHRIKRLFSTPLTETSTPMKQKLQLFSLCILLFSGFCLLVPTLINDGSNKGDVASALYRPWAIPAKLVDEADYVAVEYSLPIKNNTLALREDKPVSAGNARQTTPIKAAKLVKKPHVIARNKTKESATGDYVLAMVNEDVLPANKNKALAIAVGNKPSTDSVQSVVVKIEDQQSGKKQVNTYYFSVKNNNGNADVQPLLILKKYKGAAKNPVGKKNMPAKTSSIKKRVTT